MKNTLVVNLIGGQGAGKTTMMAHLFAWLKGKGVETEMCTEFAKELVWESRQETFKDEMYIFAKQNHRLFRVNGKVDVVVTDRPLIMSIGYNRYYGNVENVLWNNAYETIVEQTFNQYRNLNIYINRVKPFSPNGRNETESVARDFDTYFISLLEELDIDYCTYNGCEDTVEILGNFILKEM